MQMIKELGGLFGWLLLIAIVGALLNFCLKVISKKFGKIIWADANRTKAMTVLMTLFVGNHKYFGSAAILLLLVHFTIQFSTYGLNIAGGIAALLLISQFTLGVYAIVKKKPTEGRWFLTHRIIAALLFLSIALHLIAPYSLNGLLPKEQAVTTTESVSNIELPTFTLEQLSTYNGEDGNKAYVAYKGVVYDITGHAKWIDGKHNGNTAGTDLTDKISQSPHGESKFKTLEIVGTIQ